MNAPTDPRHPRHPAPSPPAAPPGTPTFEAPAFDAPPPPPPPPPPWSTDPWAANPWALGPEGPAARPGPPWADVSVQNLLLGLGTALVVVAALGFTAVNWSRMGATYQGLVLVAATAVAGVATWLAGRNRLPATAEALGVVAVMLALADAHALRIGLAPHLDGTSYWAGALGVLAAGAWALGRGADVRSPQVVAAVLGQLPLPLLALGAGSPVLPTSTAVLVQVALVLALAAGSGAARPIRRMAAVVAGAQWSALAGWALASGVWHGSDHRAAALALELGAAVAVWAAWLRRDDEVIRPFGLLAATPLALAGVGVGLATVWAGPTAWAATGLVAAAVVAAVLRLPDRWALVPGLVAGLVAAASLAALLEAAVAGFGAATTVLGRAGHGRLGTRASELVTGHLHEAGPVVAIGLATASVLVLGVARRIGRQRTGAAAAGLGLLAVVGAPVVLPVTVGGAVVLAMVAAAVLVVVAVAPSAPLAGIHGGPVGAPSDRLRLELGAGTAAGLAVLGLCWASATSASTGAALGAVALLAAAVVFAGRDRRAVGAAVAAAATVVVAGAAVVGLGFADSGVAVGPAWAAAGAGALVISLAGVLLADPEGTAPGIDGLLARTLEAVAWTIQAVALAVVIGHQSFAGAQVALLSGAVAGTLHALRPSRRWSAAVGVVHALALVWLQLGSAGVVAPEPYGLPVAAVLGGIGWHARRQARAAGRELPSWAWMGPALVIAAAPSLVASIGDPHLLRPLLLLGIGAVVLAVGALAGQRAAVDVGATVVVLIGLRQLAPVVGSMPNWATLGATGLLLLAVGATFELRRRDLVGVRHRYRSLA